MTLFNQEDYEILHSLVFRPGYPGYKPEVIELPNGDGKADTQKRYAHVSAKHLTNHDYGDFARRRYLQRAWTEAIRVAHDLGVPEIYMPSFEHGALRVLEYPAGAGSAEHTDFDLFTLNLYRNTPNEGLGELGAVHLGEIGEIVGLGKATPHHVLPSVRVQHSIVYFAIPDHKAPLPTFGGPDMSVGTWIADRIARSRLYT